MLHLVTISLFLFIVSLYFDMLAVLPLFLLLYFSFKTARNGKCLLISFKASYARPPFVNVLIIEEIEMTSVL